jgi:dehydrogenase/reductase SDR family protein 7B
MTDFKRKTIWITGASSGIGKALVKALAGKGAFLVLSARRKSVLETVKNEYGLNETNSLLLPFDLENTTNIDEYTSQVIKRFGRIDILINNGGASQRAMAIDTPIALDRKLMELNYFGPIAVTKSVLPYMKKQGQGHIVVISSISGKFGFYLRSAYSAAKHALHGFFESLRMEVYKEHIQVLLVCPGKIATDISRNALTASGNTFGQMDKAQADGMSADRCAQEIISAILMNKEEIYVGHRREGLGLWIKRFFPALFSRIIRKQKIE